MMSTARIRKEIKVLVADATRIHTELLADALRRNSSLKVFTQDAGAADIVESSLHHKIEILVIAARFGEEPLGGLEILRKVRLLRAKVRGVILLDSIKPEIILAAFRAGARGLFSRDSSIENLSDCVHKVHRGEVCASSEQMAIALEALTTSPMLRAADSNGLSLLSKRELDVVMSLAEGLTNREIAARLGLSQHTIKNYLFRIFDKLGVSSRIELLFLTMTQGQGKDRSLSSEGGGRAAQTFSSCRKAAELGMPNAQITLANMFAEGKTIKKDPLSAYKWYLICERNILTMKDEISSAKRKMAELLATEEILEAQKLASEHQRKPVQGTSTIPSSRATATGRR